MNIFEALKEDVFYIDRDVCNELLLYYDNCWCIECYSDYGRHEIALDDVSFDGYDLGCPTNIVLQALKNGYIYINGEYAEATALNYENDDWYIHTYWNEHDVKVRDYRKVWCL